MKTAVVLALLALAVSASVLPHQQHKKVADKDYLQKQKNLMQLLVRVHQPNMYLEQKSIGDQYNLEANIDKYTDTKAVKQFFNMYKKNLILPRGEIFSVLHHPHMEQAIKLFDLFYFAKDWDTFYKTACWARDRVNEGQFVYALNVAVLQRDDCKEFILPPIFEIMPNLFVDTETLQKAFEARMQDTGVSGRDVRTVVIPTNYTYNNYMWQTINPEQMLTHFTEDVGLNAYHTYFHLMYPFWMTQKKYGQELDRYGELYYYTQHQLLARYNLERLAAGLDEVDMLIFEKPIKVGYAPNLRYHNGQELPARADNMYIQSGAEYDVIDIKDVEYRIRNAIDNGYVKAKDGTKVPIYEEKGLDILGKLISHPGMSVNYKYYGNLWAMLKSLVARINDPSHKHGIAPGALEHFQSALRDPAYYRVCKRIDILFQKYKQALDRYTVDELAFPGVKIESVDIDKLVTFTDEYDIDLMNAIDVNTVEDGNKLKIVARTQRLNYKPFTYKVNIDSDKEATVMVRVFMGPKYDTTGKEMTLEYMRKFMVELDRFPYKVNSGKTVITRNSHDSNLVMKDRTSTWSLMQKVEEALINKEEMYIDQIAAHCGYPERLTLPKVQKSNVPFTFFVMVTPYDGPTTLPKAFISCGVGYNTKYPDNKPMGYPFDRIIKDWEFVTPNMYFKDVLIFHKKKGDLTISHV